MTGRVGVDLGSNAVRVAEVDGLTKDSFARVTKAATVPLQPGAIVGGRIKDPAAVAHALRRALKDAKIGPYGLVFGLTSPETAVALTSMPASLSAPDWSAALRISDKPISPKLPIAKSALSMYQVAEVAGPDGAPLTRTLLTAGALNDELGALLQVCRLAKVTPRAVDLAGAATARCLTRTVDGNDDVATLVDIGGSKVTVVTRQGLHLRSLRTFDGGGDRITRAIMGAVGCTYEDAEDLKLSTRLRSAETPAAKPVVEDGTGYGSAEESSVRDEDTSDVAYESLSTATDSLVDDIAAAVESDADAHPANPTQGIMLCGGTSLLRGLKDRLVQRTGVHVQVGRPWATVVASKRTENLLIDGAEDPVSMLTLATAIGLAMWKEA